MANLTMDVRAIDNALMAIDITGEITGFSEAQIAAAHEEASASHPQAVILNFEGLDYMNSAGIGLLVTTLIRAQRAGHRLLAAGLTDHYRQIFSLTRLDEAIGVFDTEQDAIDSMAGGSLPHS